MQHVKACKWSAITVVQEEIDRRHEVQAKLAEQRKEAERERKALREELKGKLRAVRKETADLKNLSKALQLLTLHCPCGCQCFHLHKDATNYHASDDAASS